MAKKESRKTTGEGKRGQAAKGSGAGSKSSRGEEVLGTAGATQSQPSRGEESGGGTATATLPITHEQIAERARQLWEQNGRPQGEDEQNWREAERQLKKELGIE